MMFWALIMPSEPSSLVRTGYQGYVTDRERTVYPLRIPSPLSKELQPSDRFLVYAVMFVLHKMIVGFSVFPYTDDFCSERLVYRFSPAAGLFDEAAYMR